MYNHIGVGSNVVCSISIGNARASVRGMDNGDSTSFLCPYLIDDKKETDMSTSYEIWNNALQKREVLGFTFNTIWGICNHSFATIWNNLQCQNNY